MQKVFAHVLYLSCKFMGSDTGMTNQRKHVTQMLPTERQMVESFAYTLPFYKGLNNSHIKERKAKWGVSDADILAALWQGEVIEVHANNFPDVRFVMRYQSGERAICTCASMRGEVITVWVNRVSDNHYTLDLDQYQWNVNLTSVFHTRGV